VKARVAGMNERVQRENGKEEKMNGKGLLIEKEDSCGI
jgi:hypothetical protein